MPADVAASIASWFCPERTLLPALESLHICDIWPNSGSLATFMAALAQGASPQLRELSLMLSPQEANAPSDTFSLIASALEQRRDRGCAGLAALDLNRHSGSVSWQVQGSLTVRRRLWSILLPTVEILACLYGELGNAKDHAIVDAVLEHGAPRLKILLVKIPQHLRALPRLGELKTLTLMASNNNGSSTDLGPALEEVLAAAAAGGGAQPFLPALHRLTVDNLSDEASTSALFGAIERTAGFPGVETLELYAARDMRVSAMIAAAKCLGQAFAGGAFASLQRLEFYDMLIKDEGLRALVQGLVGSPCAQTLRALSIPLAGIEGEGFRVLGEAIGQGKLPSLVELDIHGNRLKDDAIRYFVSSLDVTPSFEVLRLDGPGMSEGGIIAWATALREGRLGGRLRHLSFTEEIPDERLTSAGALALAEALVEDRQYVTQLEVLHFGVSKLSMEEGPKALVQAAAAHCPALKELLLSGHDLYEDDWAYLRELMLEGSGGHVIVHFRYYDREGDSVVSKGDDTDDEKPLGSEIGDDDDSYFDGG